MPRPYNYKDYVELMDGPTREPIEQALISSSSSSELTVGSIEYIILISVITNIVTLCSFLGVRKCVRHLRHYLKEKYFSWNLSSSPSSLDSFDEGVLFDDIYASEINDGFVSEPVVERDHA